MSEAKAVSVKDLILVPSLITLAITLLRLVGELQGWSPALFSRAAGGGGALVGISWLIVVFGAYFGWRLAQMGQGPQSPGKVAGISLLVILGVVCVAALSSVGISQNAGLAVGSLGSVIAVVVTRGLWPALWKTLVAYAFAARVPVAIVMLVAILGDWRTHYDVPPPGFPDSYSPFVKWVLIGLLPQMTIWIFNTVLGGLVCGAFAAGLLRRAAWSYAAPAGLLLMGLMAAINPKMASRAVLAGIVGGAVAAVVAGIAAALGRKR